MDIEIKEYAPVIIPTLNRYNHFVNCLESLESCTGATNTDVFVGLDFPPSEKYVEGWEMIDTYLREKEKKNKFRNLYVLRRNFNYGIKHPISNINLLYEELFEKKYDRWILSEDDNVFSPNFLEYINKGLELYKNNKDIFAIVGYNNCFDCKHDANNHFAQHSMFQAWGFGIWKDRHDESREMLTPAYFKGILFNQKKWSRILRYTPTSFSLMFKNAAETMNYLPQNDLNLSFYIINEHRKVICPVVSKVRNMGFDDTATTTSPTRGRFQERAIIEKGMAIDMNNHFEYEGDPFLYEEENSVNTTMWDQKWEKRYNYCISFRFKIEVLLRFLRFRYHCLIGKY